MRKSTGLLVILIAALLAVASIPSPERRGGWREAKVSSRPSLWEAIVDTPDLEPSRWQDGEGPRSQLLPDPITLLQAWLFWPMETLGVSFW